MAVIQKKLKRKWALSNLVLNSVFFRNEKINYITDEIQLVKNKKEAVLIFIGR